jgi:hypothetical protein
MSTSVQGVANLAADLIVRSVQQLPAPQSAPSVDGTGSAPTAQLADAPKVGANHVDVTV